MGSEKIHTFLPLPLHPCLKLPLTFHICPIPSLHVRTLFVVFVCVFLGRKQGELLYCGYVPLSCHVSWHVPSRRKQAWRCPSTEKDSCLSASLFFIKMCTPMYETSKALLPLYIPECTMQLIADWKFTIFPRTPACLFGLANYAFPWVCGTNSMLSVNCSAWMLLSPSPFHSSPASLDKRQHMTLYAWSSRIRSPTYLCVLPDCKNEDFPGVFYSCGEG